MSNSIENGVTADNLRFAITSRRTSQRFTSVAHRPDVEAEVDADAGLTDEAAPVITSNEVLHRMTGRG